MVVVRNRPFCRRPEISVPFSVTVTLSVPFLSWEIGTELPSESETWMPTRESSVKVAGVPKSRTDPSLRSRVESPLKVAEAPFIVESWARVTLPVRMSYTVVSVPMTAELMDSGPATLPVVASGVPKVAFPIIRLPSSCW